MSFVIPHTPEPKEFIFLADLNSIVDHKNVVFCNDAQVMKISSSFVRKAISERKDVRELLTEPIQTYIEEMNFYKD